MITVCHCLAVNIICGNIKHKHLFIYPEVVKHWRNTAEAEITAVQWELYRKSTDKLIKLINRMTRESRVTGEDSVNKEPPLFLISLLSFLDF